MPRESMPLPDADARLGMLTASRFHCIMSKGRGDKPSATRKSYATDLAVERLTGVSTGFTGNSATAFGLEQEPNACFAYEVLTGTLLERVGFVRHPKLPSAGASPDRLCGHDGLVEIKSHVSAARHFAVASEGVPEDHMFQMQWQMECAGKAWCDYVSWCPFLPDDYRMLIIRVPRDEATCDAMRIQAYAFESEVAEITDGMMHKVRDMTEIYRRQQ